MLARFNSIETVGDISVQRPGGDTVEDKDFDSVGIEYSDLRK